MNDFDQAFQGPLDVCRQVMGEEFVIGGVSVPGVFSELEVEQKAAMGGDRSEVTGTVWLNAEEVAMCKPMRNMRMVLPNKEVARVVRVLADGTLGATVVFGPVGMEGL